jgi:prenyl protein peptidase
MSHSTELLTHITCASLETKIAHLHHGYESFVKQGRTRQAFIQSTVVALAQLTYTTLFGWFVTFLFLRTSSLLGPCLCHSFCNMMGFPDVGSIQYYGPWKKWLYLTLGLGMVLFGYLIAPMTSPSLYGDSLSAVYWPLVR